MPGTDHRYAIALGCNRRTRYGSPAATLTAAVAALGAGGMTVTRCSPIMKTAAVGPAGRGFANAAVLVESALPPLVLLAVLKRIERAFGRRGGRRWGARSLDLDILLWSGGRWPRGTRRSAAGRLAIPHIGLALRRFVLTPLVAIAPGWRDPASLRTVRHLAWQAGVRLTPGRPAHREALGRAYSSVGRAADF